MSLATTPADLVKFGSALSRPNQQTEVQCLEKRLFPMLPVARIPWSPPALITTVSISLPLSDKTKFVTTVGRPSVMVKVPVKSEFS